MWLRLDTRSHTPMYQQIIDGVKEEIARGRLQPGDRMLTVRELATGLSLNHNTVAKAYQELEREHIIELIRGRGTFVATNASVPDLANRQRELRGALKKLLVEAHHLRVSDDDIMRMCEELIQELRHGRDGVED